MVFCQNALMPHAGYLYAGMAVRTAHAIGLAMGTHEGNLSKQEEARRTWW